MVVFKVKKKGFFAPSKINLADFESSWLKTFANTQS